MPASGSPQEAGTQLPEKQVVAGRNSWKRTTTRMNLPQIPFNDTVVESIPRRSEKTARLRGAYGYPQMSTLVVVETGDFQKSRNKGSRNEESVIGPGPNERRVKSGDGLVGRLHEQKGLELGE